MRRHQELPLCQREIQLGSKTDPSLGKAEPIRNSRSTSVVVYLRKRKMLPIRSWDRGVRICKRNNSTGPKFSAERGREGNPGIQPDILLQPAEGM